MGERDACNMAAPDWELLSMSMSASTCVNPNPNSGSGITGDKPATKNLFIYPVLDDSGNPNPSPLDPSNWINPLHEAASSDGANKLLGEHMPQQSAPPHLHVQDGSHGYVEENVSYLDIDVEPLLQADPYMAVSQDVTAEAEKGSFLHVSLMNVGADHAPKNKAGRSWKAKVVWSIAVAATIGGIVMLGRRLQAKVYQNQQLQLELSFKDEKLDGLTRQVDNLKEVLGKHYTTRS